VEANQATSISGGGEWRLERPQGGGRWEEGALLLLPLPLTNPPLPSSQL
jgi:hypothetical protein